MLSTHDIPTATGRTVRLIVADTPEQMGTEGARRVCEAIRRVKGRAAVLGFATGSTPVPLYDELISLYQEGEISFRDVVTFNLDEYAELPPYHANSFRFFMDQHLFRYVDIRPENINFPNGLTRNAAETCRRYEQRIRKAGGIDLQILGIGVNGHVAFNEPGSDRDTRTRLVKLSERTIQDNSRFFKDGSTPPRFAITMGIGTILEAREILLLASSDAKANAVYEALCEPVSPQVPASYVQEYEGPCTFIIDYEASVELSLEG